MLNFSFLSSDQEGPGFFMGVRNMIVKFTAEIPEWHGLAADMTTEITMAAP